MLYQTSDAHYFMRLRACDGLEGADGEILRLARPPLHFAHAASTRSGVRGLAPTRHGPLPCLIGLAPQVLIGGALVEYSMVTTSR